MRQYPIMLLGLLALATLCLGGCGSNTSMQNVAATDQNSGRARITITWPAPSRLIPAATYCIIVNISGPNAYSMTKETYRPTTGNTTNLEFDLLPTHTLTVTATAYPPTDATGNPVALARGVTTLTPQVGQTAQLSLILNSTIDHLTVVPNPANVNLNETIALTATAYDAAGNVVLTKPDTIRWSSANTEVATVDQNGVVTGNKIGNVTVTALETESGVKGTTAVSVGSSVAVQISPNPVTVALGETQQFSANVTNASNKTVSWQVVEPDGGTITASGQYSAPLKTGIYHVTATSLADPTKSDIATVMVNNMTLTLTANPTTIALGMSTVLTWNSTGAISVANSSFNATTTSGTMVVSPTQTTTYSITVQGPGGTRSTQVTVNVGPAITLQVSPSPVTLAIGDTQQFNVVVNNYANAASTWQVLEYGGGTVSANGLYTAPMTGGIYHVKATSVADPTKSDTATVTVLSGDTIIIIQ